MYNDYVMGLDNQGISVEFSVGQEVPLISRCSTKTLWPTSGFQRLFLQR